jgi:hypothetical protein
MVEIAWSALLRVYALFGLLNVVALAVLVRSLLRMRLFDAIKLGETAQDDIRRGNLGWRKSTRLTFSPCPYIMAALSVAGIETSVRY